MTNEIYLADLERRIAAIEANIQVAEMAAAAGSMTNKVEAAGDLAVYRRRYAELVQRLEQIKSRHAEHWGAARTELAKDIDAFEGMLGRFITGERDFE
jgi:hypothetical protein